MLRLKGEPDETGGQASDGGAVTAAETDLITPDDVFPGHPVRQDATDPDGFEYTEPRRGTVSPPRGFVIATAAFLPTFLAIFFGLQYLVGPATPARVPDEPPAVGSAPLRLDREPAVVDRPDPETRNTAPPSLPPAQPSPVHPAQEPAGPPAASQARPTMEARRPTGNPPGWTPAAAFADRQAAARLASSIEAQGYPVEIRREGSSARPWVVWIRAQPGSSAGRR